VLGVTSLQIQRVERGAGAAMGRRVSVPGEARRVRTLTFCAVCAFIGNVLNNSDQALDLAPLFGLCYAR
jgi:phage-related holin